MRRILVGLVAMGVALAVVSGARAQTCDDFNACTKNDMCFEGNCTGTPATSGSCDDFDDCTVNDRCGPEGVCMGDPAPVNTSCGGGCGKCVQLVPIPGAPLQCSGNVADNGSTCDASGYGPCLSGSCQIIQPVPEFPGVAFCLPRPRDCPDQGNCKGACNPATDRCDNSASRCFGECERCQQGQCVPTNEGGACNDFNDCTALSRCETFEYMGAQRGACMAGAPGGNTPTPTATSGLPTVTVPPTSTRTPATPPTPGACVGDCNGNGELTVNELISGVNIAQGNAALSTCPSFDVNGDGSVGINELISGVNALLNGCVG